MWPFRRTRTVKQVDMSAAATQLHVLSILGPLEAAALGGLPREAVAGVMDGDGSSIEAFRPNPVFADFLHHVIRTAGPEDLDLQAAAIRQENGWVYIIDLRTPDGPQGRVPPEDIIGAFEVRSGRIVSGSYWRNDQHLVFSAHGLVQLPPSLREAFVRSLERSRESMAEQEDRADAQGRRGSS